MLRGDRGYEEVPYLLAAAIAIPLALIAIE